MDIRQWTGISGNRYYYLKGDDTYNLIVFPNGDIEWQRNISYKDYGESQCKDEQIIEWFIVIYSLL